MLQVSELRAGELISVGAGHSTVLPDMDFESYSEAGYLWDEASKKWKSITGGPKSGLAAVGAAVYCEHPSTEVLSLAYNLKDGSGEKLWVPGMPPPQDLFDHLARGGLIEAWNCAFEYHLWQSVCHARMGWPSLNYLQMRDAMAKARAFSLPGALGKAAVVLDSTQLKDKDGTRLLNLFSKPRKPTKKDPRKRVRPTDPTDLLDGWKLYDYNLQDIRAESSLSAMIPDLSPEELDFWLNTQAGNYRGVEVRRTEVESCIAILDQAYAKYNAELAQLTNGEVKEASKNAQLLKWLQSQGRQLTSLDAADIKTTLADPLLPPHIKRALEIRGMIGSAGVKKVYAMQRQMNSESRLCDLFNYHGARTGRDTGSDVQSQNLVKAGPKLHWCSSCRKPYGRHTFECPHCGTHALLADSTEWKWEAVDHALEAINTRSLDYVEHVFGNAVLAVSGCIRGLFVAKEGKDFICSDYSSIEAVVAAVLAGEEWRIEAFRQKQDIYLASAEQITGTTLAEYKQYHAEHGSKHPDRQKIGKPAELGLGFGGWINAWRQFDSTDTFTDEQVKQLIIDWRAKSPAIVEMWGGQVRGKPWAPERFELYGLEGMAISAIMNPGQTYSYRSISYGVKDDVLYCRLPSGRLLAYHKPRLVPSTQWEGQQAITFQGYNTNPQMGPMGWVTINTYSGRLFENVAQAVARDYLRDAVNRAEPAGYPVVLRIHDELVAEVPEGFGSVEEFEQIMATAPDWAKDWPIRASGGWRGKRYRKD